jgi:hypothetical protein
VLIAYFIVDGILMIILAIAHRRELSDKWEWILVNGVIDLILAGIIISGLPGTLVWALGLLVGIDMVFGGASLIAIALEARKEAAFTWQGPLRGGKRSFAQTAWMTPMRRERSLADERRITDFGRVGVWRGWL